VPIALDNDWLAELVTREVASGVPDSARPGSGGASLGGASLTAAALQRADRSLREAPEPGLSPLGFFLWRVAGHARLMVEVAALAGKGIDPVRSRAEVVTLLAAVAGELPQALATDPGHRTPSVEQLARTASIAGYAFAEAGWPPGDPREGIPLSGAVRGVERHLAARLAARYQRAGRLEEADARRRLDQAARDLALHVEALVAVASAGAPLDAGRRRAVRLQLLRLRLPRPLERSVRESLRTPRGPEELAERAPRRVRRALAEQALGAAELADAAATAPRRFADRLAVASGMGEEEVRAIREAARQAAPAHRWNDTPAEWVPGELQGLPAEWGDAADDLREKVTQILEDNLEAIAREVRQTGELGQLLARAAAGTQLSAEERRKVKLQLIDLAKVVPALAIFAAPGGMLLLPLLAKLLPFRLLPSAWDPKESRATPAPKKP